MLPGKRGVSPVLGQPGGQSALYYTVHIKDYIPLKYEGDVLLVIIHRGSVDLRYLEREVAHQF